MEYPSFFLINVAIKHCHINKIFYSRFARPLRGNRKTWQLLLRQVHIFQIGINPLLHSVEIFSMIVASYRGGASDHAEG
jgi:hypothetical protein